MILSMQTGCPKCLSAIDIHPTQAGTFLDCPSCSNHFIVPSYQSLVEAENKRTTKPRSTSDLIFWLAFCLVFGGTAAYFLFQEFAKHFVTASIGSLWVVILWAALVFLYFFPTLKAFQRNHHQAVPIAIINTLLGWTFLAWVICLAWSYSATPNQSR